MTKHISNRRTEGCFFCCDYRKPRLSSPQGYSGDQQQKACQQTGSYFFLKHLFSPFPKYSSSSTFYIFIIRIQGKKQQKSNRFAAGQYLGSRDRTCQFQDFQTRICKRRNFSYQNTQNPGLSKQKNAKTEMKIRNAKSSCQAFLQDFTSLICMLLNRYKNRHKKHAPGCSGACR